MTQLTRPTVTPSQSTAIEAYRKATTHDFPTKSFAVALLAEHGLTESDATRAIAMGYDVTNYEGVAEL